MSHKLKLDLRYPPLRRVGFGCVRRYAPGRSLSGSGLRLIAVKRSPLNDQSGDGPGIVWIGAFSPPLVLTSVNILYFTEFCASSLAIGLQALIRRRQSSGAYPTPNFWTSSFGSDMYQCFLDNTYTTHGGCGLS